MQKLILAMSLPVFLAFGCTRQESHGLTDDVPEPASEAVESFRPLVPRQDQLADDSVVARVGERELLYGSAMMEADARLAPYLQDIPPGQIDMARQHMLQTVLEQFIKRAVLLDEAARLEIAITTEEEAEAYRKIQESLPPGRTVEEIIQSSSMGEERMREEVRVGLVIDKLLAREMSNRVAVVDEAAVEAFIEEHREQMSMPEMVRARHILLGIDETADDAAREQRRQEAEALRRKLLEGADFAETAMAHSTCPSAQRGGDLGFVRRGQMVAEFDEAVFSQELDETGPLVKTQYGYHIIQIYEKREAGFIPREEIREMLEGRGMQEGIDDYIQELMESAEIFVPGQ